MSRSETAIRVEGLGKRYRIGVQQNSFPTLRKSIARAAEEPFLDTPVRHYSSGVYIRLALAGGAQLKLQILIVDQVLAVGDAAFQRVCLAKMKQISAEGHTVLFVSDNLALIQSLDPRVILLCNGSFAADHTAAKAIEAYLQSLEVMAAERPAAIASKRCGPVMVIPISAKPRPSPCHRNRDDAANNRSR
jgi:lipopolysaccharide transport system ATP-binding protein